MILYYAVLATIAFFTIRYGVLKVNSLINENKEQQEDLNEK